MRVPPYYRQPLWQRFFAGALIGGLISWCLFFYMYGVMQEKQVQKIDRQIEEIKDLNQKLTLWEDDYQKLNDKNQQKLTIQEVQVLITNEKIHNLDRLSVAEAQEAVRDDFTSLITKDVESVFRNKDLLKKSIENKVIEINKKRYRLQLAEIIFYTTIYIEVRLVRL